MLLLPLGPSDLVRGRWLVRDSMMDLVGLGGGVGLVGYRVRWLAVVVESPACRTLAC